MSAGGGRRVRLSSLAGAPDVAGPAVDAAAVPAAVGDRRVSVHEVAPNPLNKRPAGEDDEIAAVAETIREYGVIQPLVVCSVAAYLVAYPAQRDVLGDAAWVALIGNRRLRAARLAGLREIDIVVNDEQASTMYEVMLVENGQRRDLPAWLEAEAMDEVLATAGISQRELGRRIGKSAMYVTQRLALLRLVPELRELLEQGELTIEQGRTFGDLPEDEQRAIAAAGAPYRRPGVNGVYTGPRAAPRAIRVTTPAAAAASIREQFDEAELRELIKLLRVPAAARAVPLGSGAP
ncbi:MAG: ParB/RepB/Spo0J family partition protein [Pseudonocardia sp.]|nr:ParB/RepB/Spo0J family partition protein [Pseudonocardia sp.]